MKLVIEIDMSNDAFQPEPDDEIVDILHSLATRIDSNTIGSGGFPYSLYDCNGNSVGFARLED